MKDLIKKMLVTEPDKRMTIEACLEHSWFKQFENDKKIKFITKRNKILSCEIIQ